MQETAPLTGPRREAASGKAQNLVVFLHGYGADGNDLMGLADILAPGLPHTLFLAPNAPQPCRINPAGRQWFPLPWLDNSPEDKAREDMYAGFARLESWLAGLPSKEGIPPARICLFGFSQGAMMALQTGPRQQQTLAGILGFSGRLLRPEALKDEVVTKPPVLLVHGDQDQVVPPSSLGEAAEGLTQAGIRVQTRMSRGTGHEISPEGLELALKFIQNCFLTP